MGAVAPQEPLQTGRGCTRELGAPPAPLPVLGSPVPLINGFVALVPAELPARALGAPRVGQGTAGSPGCVGWPGPGVTSPLSPQGAVLSQLLRAGTHLDGVLLEAVTVLGVTSPPRQVLANGALVSDFSYRSDTQASALRAPWGAGPPAPSWPLLMC